MREIKFRAWDKKRKEFLKSFDIGCRGMIICDERHETQNIVLMQYTGLHDKNGKEIYESDIVKINYRNDPVVMSWREREAQWSLAGFFPEHLEVIGNIYENPELLK